jgi:hypothetical protein
MAEQPGRGAGRVRPAEELRSALSAHAPWMPATFTPEIIGALQAMNRGDAAAHQQHMVLKWLIDMGHNNGALYFPGEAGRRDTDFALGRKWVADQIQTALRLRVKSNSEQG